MAYFRVYTMSFTDNHQLTKANWRIDILDDQANAGVSPLVLQPSDSPAQTTRPNTGDDKNAPIVFGRQLSFSYDFQGFIGEPDAKQFFDVDERRYRVELYKNNQIDGVFYINPGSSKRRYKAVPYTVELTAVDDMAFLKGTTWNAYTEDGFLDYRWMNLYEILITRGIDQLRDNSIKVNVINNLKPDNIGGDNSFLNDLYLHSEMFIDFVKGPDTLDIVFEKINKQFPCRVFLSGDELWIIRLADQVVTNPTIETYVNGIVSSISATGMRLNVGASVSGNNATPIKFDADVLNFRALKQVTSTVNFRSINQLRNFQWEQFDGTNFADWDKNAFAFTVSRNGTGTIDDPFTAFLSFAGETSPDDQVYYMSQGSGVIPFLIGQVGDIFEAVVKYKFSNTTTSYMTISGIDTVTGDSISLGPDGSWKWTTGNFPPAFVLSRSGRNREGNLSVLSQPIPKTIDGHVLSGNIFQFFFALHTPVGLNSMDGPIASGIDFYPVKLGIYNTPGIGRDLRGDNTSRVSQQKPLDEAYLLDTGLTTLANTVAVNNSGMPSQDWAANGDSPQDIERRMIQYHLDQYYKAVTGWEGNLYSNNLSFWHIFVLDYLPGQIFTLTGHDYDIRTCAHKVKMQEIFPENSASIRYLETDKYNVNSSN